MQQLILSEGWQLKERAPARDLAEDFASAEGWIAASVPGTAHEALLAAGRIPDPFYGLNERDVQWVGERDWLYRCAFDLTEDQAGQAAALCFDGLDTIATVWLNGTKLLASDNMFVPLRAPTGGLLRPGRNELGILFESAFRHGKAIEAQLGKRAVWNTDPSRLYVRKAQYHYGWDWGPCLIAAGPWLPVRIELGAARIADLYCPAEVAADLSSATLPVSVACELGGTAEGALELRLELRDPSGALVDSAALPAAATVRHTFTVARPALWWPNGMGGRPLYSLVATLGPTAEDRRPTSSGTTSAEETQSSIGDRRELRLGLRRLRLIQEPLADEPGTTFLFEVNNTPLFGGGANWIPADSFTTRVSAERYRALLQQAADANMNMLRIWGGGIYEADVFYDLCDELGLLVWQDFMFACGMYPAHDSFLASVRAEAEAQVRRLRHHPSMALWCGNNEDYQIAESIRAYDPAYEGDLAASPFPARAIYERLLPEVCAALDPTRPYWPGSPWGGAGTTDQTIGDRHTWDIWHGGMAPYTDYPRFAGRFVSEFGMQASAALATIEPCLPPTERYPQSRAMDFHNKAPDGPQRLAAYMNFTLRSADTLPAYVYASQLVQAEALASAYRGWRRRWAGPGRYAVAGALVWQLDDCWPVTSWAIVDYELRPKPAYYVTRRELAPLALGLARVSAGAEVWAVNATPEPIEGELVVRAFALDGAEALAEERRAVTLPPLQATELGAFERELPAGAVIGARLLVGGQVAARAALWTERLKYCDLPDPQVTIERLDGERLAVRSALPAKGVWLDGGDGVAWSDNMLDLLPGDTQVVNAPGLGDRDVRVTTADTVAA